MLLTGAGLAWEAGAKPLACVCNLGGLLKSERLALGLSGVVLAVEGLFGLEFLLQSDGDFLT